MSKKNERPNQVERILDYLSRHGSITQFEAISELGILRLASRISEMKDKYGIKIKSEMVEVTNRFGEKCRVARYTIL